MTKFEATANVTLDMTDELAEKMQAKINEYKQSKPKTVSFDGLGETSEFGALKITIGGIHQRDCSIYTDHRLMSMIGWYNRFAAASDYLKKHLNDKGIEV